MITDILNNSVWYSMTRRHFVGPGASVKQKIASQKAFKRPLKDL